MNSKVEASIRRAHSYLNEQYMTVQVEVREQLRETCEIQKWVFEDRLKSPESFASKLMTGRFQGYDIDDFYACTVVVPNLRGVSEAVKLVTECLDVIEKKPGDETKALPTSFGFDSVRLYCRTIPSVNQQKRSDLKFEVQIKTLLEHAWAKATHDFSYKGAEASWAKERLSAQIKAVLDNVDLSINEMENIAASKFLNRRNPNYEMLSQITTYLKSEFGTSSDEHGHDYKRMAENIKRILTRADISLDELKACMAEEERLGRGKKSVNLSLSSSLLLGLLTHQSEKMNQALKRKDSRRPVTIPLEVVEECDLDTKDFKDVSVLKHYKAT